MIGKSCANGVALYVLKFATKVLQITWLMTDGYGCSSWKQPIISRANVSAKLSYRQNKPFGIMTKNRSIGCKS